MKKIKYFSASWCQPCKVLGPIVEGLFNEGLINLEKIDIDEKPQLANENNIRGIPTMILFEDEVEISRNTGVLTRDALLAFYQ